MISKFKEFIHRNVCKGKVDEPIELIMSRQGFNEFARGLFARRNSASHGDVIATFTTGRGQQVVMKIINNANTSVK